MVLSSFVTEVEESVKTTFASLLISESTAVVIVGQAVVSVASIVEVVASAVFVVAVVAVVATVVVATVVMMADVVSVTNEQNCLKKL